MRPCFSLSGAKVRSVGDRVELTFDGLRMGIFEGAIAYTFYPGSRLVQQTAVAATNAQDVAYYYDAGLRMTADADRRPGGNMESEVAYYDPAGRFQTAPSSGPERVPVKVGYRTLAFKLAHGAHRRVPRAAPVFLPARLHHEHGLSVAPNLARRDLARHPPVAG